MPTSLPCEDGGGSLNNPNGTPAQLGTNNPALVPYVAPNLPVGTWQITGLNPGICDTNENLVQQEYVAETLNISGAPINIFKLLGIHQQGNGSVLSKGRIISSTSYPGHPLTGINGSTPWWSLQSGPGVAGVAYVGVDFGIKLLSVGTGSGSTEYEPEKQKWTQVGAISITQSNSPVMFASQVRVEFADGECIANTPAFTGAGNGILTVNGLGSNVTVGVVTVTNLTPTTFNVFATLADNSVIGLGAATVGVPFFSTFINFTITNGPSPFGGSDFFTIQTNYVWKRAGIFNLAQSPSPQILNLQKAVFAKAVRVIPTLFTGSLSWEVAALDVFDSPPPDINNIQDLFFNENRDRDYALEPIMLKAAYTPTDSINDLSRFGLNILDQYSFTVSFASMVQGLGRPIVVGDIVEVMPEMQWDQNLKPIRKFLEVTDSGWASEGFGPQYKPMVYKFTAQQALPSQETRDIFGTMDTQKYLVADSILTDGIGQQLDTTPLTITEEIIKMAEDAVPETGSDDVRSTDGVPLPHALPPSNLKGQPHAAPNNNGRSIGYIEAGLPPDGLPYGEGFKLPPVPGPADGDYFRLYYPPETKIPPRLHRFSLIKNRWIFIEADRRGDYSSHKPSVRNILQSNNQQGLKKKQT